MGVRPRTQRLLTQRQLELAYTLAAERRQLHRQQVGLPLHGGAEIQYHLVPRTAPVAVRMEEQAFGRDARVRVNSCGEAVDVVGEARAPGLIPEIGTVRAQVESSRRMPETRVFRGGFRSHAVRPGGGPRARGPRLPCLVAGRTGPPQRRGACEFFNGSGRSWAERSSRSPDKLMPFRSDGRRAVPGTCVGIHSAHTFWAPWPIAGAILQAYGGWALAAWSRGGMQGDQGR